jgi:hypothetical protein
MPVFAFFGLGVQELLLLAILAGGVAAVVFIALFISRSASGPPAGRPSRDDRVAELEEENRRLRSELDRQKGASSSPPPPQMG